MNIYDGKLYIQTGHSKRIAKQIASNSKVELCAFDGEQWIRLSGKLIEDNSIDAKKSMLDSHPKLRSIYDEHDSNTAVYYFTNATAYFSSFTAPDELVCF